MTPRQQIEVNLQAILAHAEAHGVTGLSRIERAVLDGLLTGMLLAYLRWHEAVWA